MGEFAKWAEKVLPEASRPPVRDWRERASEQVEQFRNTMPLSAEEGAANAERALNEIYQLLYGLGYRMRMQRHLDAPEETTKLLPTGDPGIPGRDISISLPKTASWLEPRLLSKEAIGPLRAWAQNKEVESKAKMREKRRKAFARTADPMTNPLFAPTAAITAPEAFRKGFTQADLDAAAARKAILSEELAKAKAEFEQALAEEYRGRKAASAGELVDGLANATFLLDKRAVEEEPGLGAKALNTYLALAALLGYGAHRAAEDWTAKREPGAQKQKLYRLALRQRMHDKGVPIVVDFNDLPAAKEEANLINDLPVPEVKEASGGPFRKGAKIRLLGAEGMDPDQVSSFNTEFSTKGTWTPPASRADPMPSVAERPPQSAARDAAVDASMGTVQEPIVRGTPGAFAAGSLPMPVDTSRPYNPAVHGKDYMTPYKMPEGYTPPAGSSVGKAWEGIAQNRRLLGELPGGAEYDQRAREHAYEGEQVYQSLRAANEKRYQDMAAKGWISPTNNAGVYDDWRKQQQNARDRAEMGARAERARKGIQEKGLQGQWEDYQSRGGWRQEYPKGTNFNIDVNDPRTQTPEMRRNIAMGKIDKGRAQAAGSLLNKVQSGQFNRMEGRANRMQTTRANVLTGMGRGKQAAAVTARDAFKQLSRAMRKTFPHHIVNATPPELSWRRWYNQYSPEIVQAWEKLLHPKVRRSMLQWTLRHPPEMPRMSRTSAPPMV